MTISTEDNPKKLTNNENNVMYMSANYLRYLHVFWVAFRPSVKMLTMTTSTIGFMIMMMGMRIMMWTMMRGCLLCG